MEFPYFHALARGKLPQGANIYTDGTGIVADRKWAEFIARMETGQRLSLAKEFIEAIVDHVIQLVAVEQATKILFESTEFKPETLGRAGVAASRLRYPLLRMKLIGALALWDEKCDKDTITFQALADLLDCSAVHDAIELENYKSYNTYVPPPQSIVGNGNITDEQRREIHETLVAVNIEFARKKAYEARDAVIDGVREIRRIAKEPRVQGLWNHRVRAAHLVRRTRAEIRGQVPQVLFRDEMELFDTSLRLSEKIYCSVCGKSFSISNDVREIERKNAEDLWLKYLRPL